MTKIFIGADHAGFVLKSAIIQNLSPELQIADCGVYSTESVDYPLYSNNVCQKVLKTPGAWGVLICATGIGMSIAANRKKGVRAALCRTMKDARLSRHHNDANVLVLGASITSSKKAQDILLAFLTTLFDGGRHARRTSLLDE